MCTTVYTCNDVYYLNKYMFKSRFNFTNQALLLFFCLKRFPKPFFHQKIPHRLCFPWRKDANRQTPERCKNERPKPQTWLCLGGRGGLLGNSLAKPKVS